MKYEQVNEIMSRIATPLSLYLVPTNYDKEFDKFFDSVDYNPQFKYRRAEKNKGIFEKLDSLEEVTDVDPEISDYIVKVIADKKQAAALLEAIGNDEAFLKVQL